jgi:hypothetical protein
VVEKGIPLEGVLLPLSALHAIYVQLGVEEVEVAYAHHRDVRELVLDVLLLAIGVLLVLAFPYILVRLHVWKVMVNFLSSQQDWHVPLPTTWSLYLRHIILLLFEHTGQNH